MSCTVVRAITALCPGPLAGQRAPLHLYITTLLGFLVLLWSTTTLAVPPGTIISNVASINYTIGGLPGLPLSSNIDQFTVVAAANTVDGTMSVAAPGGNLYAGSPRATTITLNNTGTTLLNNQQLTITAPLNSQVTLTGSGVTLAASMSSSTTTTYIFNVADLPVAGSQDLQLVLTAAPTAVSRPQTFTVAHSVDGTTLQQQSLTLSALPRTAARLEILQHSLSNRALSAIVNSTLIRGESGTFTPIAPPTLPEAPDRLVTDSPITLEPANVFSNIQTLFIRVTDLDQNLDSTVQESLDITIKLPDRDDYVTLRILETGIATGIFSGYVTFEKNSATSSGALPVKSNSKLLVSYTDTIDGDDSVAETVLIDPYGVVFDSATGQPLDGYTVQMVNTDTGLPATVYGDDGVSSYPATVITGSPVTDSSGNLYSYNTGEYRFPLAPAGNYRLVVTSPSSAQYRWPSTQSTEQLHNLSRSNLAITLGSRGERFPLLPGPPLHIDIPVDPLTTQLYLQRSANRESVATGDLIRYSVQVENSTATTLNDVVLTESLPHGFRLEPGSINMDNNPQQPATIEPQGTTFTLNLGAMIAGERRQIRYVSAVGAARQGLASSSSHARANSGAANSNHARHDAMVFDELMRGRALLLGQVIINPTDNDPTPASGLKGVRIYMEDGRYAISDERGMFHFDNLTPGNHLVQLDTATLPDHYSLVMGDQDTRNAHSPSSQFIDLQGGTLWRTEFHVARKPTPTGALSLQLSNTAPDSQGNIPYQVTLENRGVSASNLRLTLMIPATTHYQPGSSHVGGHPVGDPDIVGNVLIYRLNNDHPSGGWQRQLHLTLQGDTGNSASGDSRELTTKASLQFDTPAQQNQRLPLLQHTFTLTTEQVKQGEQKVLAESLTLDNFNGSSNDLSEEHKTVVQQLAERWAGQDIHIHAIGHSDSRDIIQKEKEDQRLFANNQILSEYRAHEVANQLRQQLSLPANRISFESKGEDEPVASNATSAGRATNRRVELHIYSVISTTTPHIHGTATTSERLSSTITGLTPGEQPITTATVTTTTEYNSQWLASQTASIEWLLPQERPALPTTNIAIKHHSDQNVTLTLNGQPVAAMNFNGTLNNSHGAAVSHWAGVDLNEGDNLFHATISNAQGEFIQQLNRNLHYSSAPVRAEIVPTLSTLIADSITPPVIAVRLYDKDSHPIHAGMEIEYQISPPHQPAQESFNTDNMVAAPGRRHYATSDNDGLILIKLAATNSTDDLRLQLPLAHNRTVELKSRLQAKARDWILVGLAEGEAGFNSLSGNMEALDGNAAQDHLYQDQRIAFFAKGQVLGKWLLTLAYDSDKAQPQKQGNDPALFQAIDPGSYYTVYGDAGQNGFDAASSKKLYLKLERNAFYLLFGDYQTQLSETRLARYDRTLTGIKSRYQNEQYNLMLFISENSQSFAKDELRGQGSTGPYPLSRSNVALNSEKVVLEVRDRFRSEQIVSSTLLARHSDYDINYLEGNITFREPVFSTDANLNPQYIVIKYESYTGDSQTTIGGRAEVKVNDQLKIGVTQVSEGRATGDALLGAADLQYKFNDATTLRLETARSLIADEGSGNAYLAEVEHQTVNSSSKLYLLDNDTHFGLGQTNASENGMYKQGVETQLRASDNINIKGQLYRQESSLSHASRDLAEAQGEISRGTTRLRAGLREVQDQRGDNSQQQSEQLTTGISQQLLDSKVTLRADREINLNNGNDSIDFPDKTRLGADYHITQKISLFAEQEVANSDLRDTRQRRLGIKSNPWNGAEIYSGLSHSSSDNGTATSANVAARQRWQLNPQWSVDAGIEQSQTLSQNLNQNQSSGPTLSPPAATPFNLNSGFAIGSNEDFSAASLGVTYSDKGWLWSSRVESRTGDLSDRRRLATSVQTSPHNDLSMLASLNLLTSSSAQGEQQDSSTVQLGAAYRPSNSRWLLLDKLTLKKERHNNSTLDSSGWRIINLFNANYREGRWQTSLQYGAKSVKETIDGNEHNQFVDLSGIESRYDLTPEWDIGLHGNILHAWQLNQYNYNSGVSVGHTVAKNIWLSLGYNFNGFRDSDFSRSSYTSQGLFLRFRMKFDQTTVKEAIQWASQ